MRFINYNGEIVSETCPLFTANHRLRFADGFFETLRVFNGKIAWAEKHQHRITTHSQMLKMELPPFDLEREVSKTLAANFVKHGRVRLQFFRNDGGRYLPVSQAAGFVIEVENDGAINYTHTLLKRVGVSEKYFKSTHFLGNIKSSNALLYVLAAIEATENGWDDSILLNEKGNVCEALSSNLFMVSNNVFFTPPLSSGCVNGVMRKTIREILLHEGAKVEETDLKPADLRQADEVFLTNASKGIQSIIHLHECKQLSIHKAENLVQRLNNLVFQTG